ncbi:MULTISPECIES: C40 family peptidase [unclassified Knoellia]|uniref:C40 family peptidase n=1 Tax=Knoellia altitudinis TaxID=3404795 RepID=UPI003614CC8B
MAHSTQGRHRTPGRHNPVSELSVLASRAGATGAKATAVLAASGGLVAAFALPASAAPDTAQQVRSSAPAAPAVAAAAPAISAPLAATPVVAQAVGVTGVTVIAKPKPKPRPKPVVRVEEPRESRLVAAGERSERSETSRRSTRTRTTPTTSRSSSRTRVTAPTESSSAPSPSSTSTSSKSSSQVVNIARGLLGIAYVYGGSTPAGFDCSGFTQYVYNKAGISIPRTASAQQRAATRVSSPRPGDLVFYGSPAYHVGIFTGGDMMIDSPRTGKFSSERNMWGTPTGFGRF